MKKMILPLLILLVLAAGCKNRQPDSNAKPNLYLIVVDTLRADKVGAYGNKSGLTPVMDVIARQGVVFENCYSTSSWTVPAMASMMTGQYPVRHGIQHGMVRGFEQIYQQELPADFETFAERFRAAGYATHGFVTNAHLIPEFGFAQGFDTYEVHHWQTAEFLNNQVLSKKKQVSAAKPYFLFLQYFDPHEPYSFHKWLQADYPKEVDKERVVELSTKMLFKLEDEKQFLENPAEQETLEVLYENEIRYWDIYLGKILKKLGVTDRDALIITSDHGESLMDHGFLGHGNGLYNNEVKVPLILRFPDKAYAGRRVQEPVSLIDLLPTALGMMDVAVDPTLPGTDLAAALKKGALENRTLYADIKRPNIQQNAVMIDGWKFIHNVLKKTDQLFDMKSDPGELEDQSKDDQKRADQLKQLLDTHAGQVEIYEVKNKTVKNYSEADLDQLKSMGYLN